MNNTIVLSFSCDDKMGIVASVTSFFAENNFNIEESSQHEDPDTGRFFMRTVFKCTADEFDIEDIKERFSDIAHSYEMTWHIHDRAEKMRVLLAVSKWGHCLNSILNSWKSGSLPIDIVGVVSNHDDMRSLVDWYGLPYVHLPVTPDTKPEQEAKILKEMEERDADLLVLARYMQILSDSLCSKLEGRAINIHHSFLPGFKGAKPYHQAHERGVKLIGATAHYVTADLDEGPIIEQSVERVSHAETPEEMVEIGRDIESVVLNRGNPLARRTSGATERCQNRCIQPINC